ncbi:DUF6198 family protein [Helcococcus massiliensis]|uniref:DUF6198 family protein n=1 Tax=Helcococcus massiliensis TaxID=2040290 RepID=UPI000CDE9C6D|nr:DUF6198 family protein [Helcococcus massiliensis]
MKTQKRVILTLLTLILLGFGVALQTKAAVGVSLVNSTLLSISMITGMKFGTVSIIVNSLFILLQIIILRKNVNISLIFQAMIMVTFGFITNFFLYNIFTFELTSYSIRLVLFTLSYLIIPFTLVCLKELDIASMPIEGFCKLMEDKKIMSFSNTRLSVDIVALIATILIVIIFNIPSPIREGTIISLFLLNYMIRFYIKILEPKFNKLELAN